VSEYMDDTFIVTGRNNSFHSLWYIRWRALNKQEAYRAENHSRTLSHEIFFLTPHTYVHAYNRLLFLSLPLSFDLSVSLMKRVIPGRWSLYTQRWLSSNSD